MNREEIKNLLSVMQAFADGKTIQAKGGNGIWHDGGNELKFDLDSQDYRIKPEPTYRPFRNSEECWTEMQRHQPFGWTKLKGEIEYSFITDVKDDMHYSEAFKKYTFADGTPFGIEEENNNK